MIRLLISVLAAAATFAPPIYAEGGVSPKEIRIGQSITLQNGNNEYGQAVLQGIQAYLADVNTQGGVHGRKISLHVLDDEGINEKAELNARQLIEKEQVFILFGSIEGGPSTAVGRVATEKSVPLFGPMAGSPGLRRPHQSFVFPVRAEHRQEFHALLTHARSVGLSRVAFLRSDSEVGAQHLANVQALCKELGMAPAVDLPFKSDISEEALADLVKRAVKGRSDFIMNHGSSGVYERLIRQVKSQNSNMRLYGVNSGSAQMARKLGDMAHGMVFSQVVPSPWEAKTQIVREYQKVFPRHNPGAKLSYGSLEGFITAKALVSALQAAGPNPTRENFVKGLYAQGPIDLKGIVATYTPGNHAGASFVDLALVSRRGDFLQ